MDGEIQSETEPEAAPVKLKYRRKLTPFLCQEMLYEYATGALDPQRRADMDEFLATDKSSQDALEAVRRGLDYSGKLAGARLSPELVEKLGGSENFRSLFRRYLDWDEWPETLRWSITALTISVMVAGIVTIVPWRKLPQISKKPAAPANTVVLADIPGSTGEPVPEGAANPEDPSLQAAAADSETSGDEHDLPGTHDHPHVAEAEEKTTIVAAPSPTAKPTATAKPVAVSPPAAPSQAAAPNPATPVTPSEVESNNASTQTSSREIKPKGFVYRAFMNLANVDEVTPDVVAQLESFGAEKAGEVPLGWRRGSGSYFHFTLPQSNEEKVLEMLRGYGPVRISKDPHPRVMPTGQIRIILWIEPASN